MNQNHLLATLQENRFMQTEAQVTIFENALAEIAEDDKIENISVNPDMACATLSDIFN
jgi:hypothetical protein